MENGYRKNDNLQRHGVYKYTTFTNPDWTKSEGTPVFRLKRDADGKPVRWKWASTLSFEQIMVKTTLVRLTYRAMESWRILLHIAAVKNWDAQQIDVKRLFCLVYYR